MTKHPTNDFDDMLERRNKIKEEKRKEAARERRYIADAPRRAKIEARRAAMDLEMQAVERLVKHPTNYFDEMLERKGKIENIGEREAPRKARSFRHPVSDAESEALERLANEARAKIKADKIANAPLMDRIKQRINIDHNGCWIWSKTFYEGKKARIHFNGKTFSVRKAAYEYHFGPTSLLATAKCGVEACVNPDHVDAITHKEFQRRRMEREQRTHCNNGHKITRDSHYVSEIGKKICRACFRERVARYRAKKKDLT